MTVPSGEKLRTDAFWSLAYRCAALGAAFLTTALVARAVGREGKGLIDLFVLVPFAIAQFSHLGLGARGVTRIGHDRENVGRVHGTAIVHCGIVAVVCAVFVALGGGQLLHQAYPDADPLHLDLALLLGPAALYVLLWQDAMLAVGLQAAAQRLMAAVNVLGALTACALYLTSAPLGAFVALLACVIAARAAGGVLALRASGRLRMPTWRWVGADLRHGRALYASALLAQALLRIDQFVVGAWLSLADLGVYAISVSLAEILWIATTSITGAVVRTVAARDTARAQEATATATRQSVLVALVGGALVAAVAWFVIPLLFGEEFAGAYVPLLVLLPGIVCAAAGQPLNAYLNYHAERPGAPAVAKAVGLGVHLVLLALLLPHLGILAAAIASAAGYAVALVGTAAAYRSITGTSIRATLLPRRSDLSAFSRLANDLRQRS